MRHALSLIGVVMLFLSGCTAEPTEVPATELIVRVTADATVQSALGRLRLRTAGLKGSGWGLRTEKTYAAGVLKWPVDFVLLPSSDWKTSDELEIILDALDATDAPLVQARVLTSFVARQARIVPISLAACGSRALGQLCEPNADCYGRACLTCVAGTCAATPLLTTDDLPVLTAVDVDAGSRTGGDDASGPQDTSDATTTPPVSTPPVGTDASAPDFDSSVASMDAALPAADASNAMNEAGGELSCLTGYVKEGNVCRDLCAGACDPMATCNATSGTARCSCPPAYVTSDNGKTCTFDSSCSLLKCDTHATCTVSGSTRSCACLTGYSGTGTTCTNVNECSATPPVCGANSTCSDTQGSHTCGCQTNYRRVGDTCIKNPCAPNPCANGGVCSESSSGIAVCACPSGYDGPTCAHNIDDCSPNPCQNGGTCTDALNNYSCACSSNYTGTRCELQFCGDITIRSAADLIASRLCKEIRGTLNIVSGATSITSNDLPYLTRITGNLVVTTTGATMPFVETISLSTLQTIEGSLQIIANNKLTSASFPGLTAIGRPDVTPALTLQVQQSSIGHLDMPALTTIYGNAQIAVLQNLCSANLRNVTSVTGAVTLLNLINLPYTAIKPLVMFASSASATNVGCCTGFDTFMCSSSVMGTCLASCP